MPDKKGRQLWYMPDKCTIFKNLINFNIDPINVLIVPPQGVDQLLHVDQL